MGNVSWHTQYGYFTKLFKWIHGGKLNHHIWKHTIQKYPGIYELRKK